MDILKELKQERDRIDAAIRVLDRTRGGEPSNGRRRGRRPGRPRAAAVIEAGRRKPRRRLSAAARRKISNAAKARWAKAKKADRTSLAG